MTELPDWNELSEDEQQVVDALAKCADVMGSFSADRVLLFAAFFNDGLVSTLADRVLAARQMGANDMIDPRVHITGMALASAMNEFRVAYEVCFDDEALAGVKDSMEASLKLVDDLAEDFTPENMKRVVDHLNEMLESE